MINADRIDLIPGTPEHDAELSASKVSAVLRLSPWESRYSVWWRMRGALDPGRPNAAMQRGHDLEAAIAQIGARRHGLRLRPGGCWRSRERPWQVATPDGLAYPEDGRRIRPTTTPVALVECKTSADWENWGPDNTDDVPPYYRAQALAQMDTLGVHTCLLVAALPRYVLRTYWLEPQPGELEWLRDECERFLKTLAADEVPDIDADGSTYAAIKQLHPLIEDRAIDVPDDLARSFIRAHTDLRAAKAEAALQTSRLADHMGLARHAVIDGTDTKIAWRQPANGGPPYVKAVTNFPLLPDPEAPDA